MARQIGQALLERIDVVDVVFIAAEHGNDVVEDFGIHVAQEVRVEFAQLIKGIELMNDAVLVRADHMSSSLM